MNREQEVKKILDELSGWLQRCEAVLRDENFSRALVISAIGEMQKFVEMEGKEISQLFEPKPDESLENVEVCIHSPIEGEAYCGKLTVESRDKVYSILEPQIRADERAKTLAEISLGQSILKEDSCE